MAPSNVELLTLPIREVAQTLARMHKKAEPNIKEIYLFPHPKEIRLVEIDSSVAPTDDIDVFYFGPDPANGILFPSGVALIHPHKKDQIKLPKGWGSWKLAVKVWPLREGQDGRLARRVR